MDIPCFTARPDYFVYLSCDPDTTRESAESKSSLSPQLSIAAETGCCEIRTEKAGIQGLSVR